MSPNSPTLTVTFTGTIETPPSHNREQFRQCVISTLLYVLKTQDVAVEYIGYRPDPVGVRHMYSKKIEFEDTVFASLSLNTNSLSFGQPSRIDDFVKAFVETFENTTHRHLLVEWAKEDDASHDIEIEMSSDWKLLLKSEVDAN